MSTTKYIPALRFRWLTPMYDFFLNVTMPEKRIKQALIDLASIHSNSTVLDFGCGAATLTIMIKQMNPEANLTGIDVDMAILNKAVQKIKKSKLDILLRDYDGILLPFQDNSFDRILSCLVFHHLDTEKKQVC